MTYDETDGALVSIARAQRECRDHGAVAIVDDIASALRIYDSNPNRPDYWGAVVIVGDSVPARAVLNVLGY